MPSRFRAHCLDCDHDWDGLRSSIDCGPIEFHELDTYRCYFCPRCFVELYVVRRLSRSSWLRWVSQNASEMTRAPMLFLACELGVRVDVDALTVIARSPLLFEACARVSGILAGTRSRYVPIPIDIGIMVCPACGDRMPVGCVGTSLLVCPLCESRSARSMGDHHSEMVLVDYVPLKEENVRSVILHLQELAEHPKDLHSKRTLAFTVAESRGPLWDCELDG
jgi:hypothetical protein